MKIITVAGARPNFMKVAPIIRAIHAHNQNGSAPLTHLLVHTGQHYDEKMSGVFFQELGIPAPDINLAAGSGSHATQTANIMAKFDQVCEEQRPDWVIVVGDVNSTLACTLVGVKRGIKVAHVEAGLRSFDRTMPEEINRIVTDSIADLLLTPSEDANENLQREGVDATRIRLVGNVMIDTLLTNLPAARQRQTYQRFRLERHAYVYATLHRPQNVDSPDSIRRIVHALAGLAKNFPVILPIHPRTLKNCSTYSIPIESVPGLILTEPIGYLDSLSLIENSRFVLTDSGGLQEETTYFRTPCLTLRPNTQRPITITTGSNSLTTVDRLDADIAALLKRDLRYGSIPPLWDGAAAPRIVQQVIENT